MQRAGVSLQKRGTDGVLECEVWSLCVFSQIVYLMYKQRLQGQAAQRGVTIVRKFS